MTTIAHVSAASGPTSVGAVDAGSGGSSTGPDSISLLPEPACFGGNTVIELAMLITQVNAQDRDNETKREDAADVAAAADSNARVDAMRRKADDDFSAGLASGLGQIGAGGLAIAGAFVGDNTTGHVLTASKDIASGAGTIVSAGYKASADRDDADAAKYSALADADVRVYNRADDGAKSAAQAIQQVEQYLASILSAQATTASAATGYRA